MTILERKNAGLSHTKAKEKAFMIQNARIVVIPVSGFVVIPMRWIVERSNAWMERCKSLVKNFDRTLVNANARRLMLMQEFIFALSGLCFSVLLWLPKIPNGFYIM